MISLIFNTLATVLCSCVLISSCHTHYNTLRSPGDFNKQINANNLAIFGKLQYQETKKKSTFLLLFKNDSLTYISPVKKLKNHSSVYKVLSLSDTLNILCSEFFGQYYSTDTLFFYPDECFWKNVVYNDPGEGLPQKSSPAIADFRHYKFSSAECRIEQKRYSFSYPNVIAETVPIYDYCNKIKLNAGTDSLIDKTYLYQKYSDKKEAMLRFVTSFLR